MSRHALLALLSFVIAMSTAGPGSSTLAQTTSAEEALVKKARAIHEKVITLDTHIDFSPGDLVGERNYTQRLETQFNLPNMIDGGLDALFFSIYVGQTREAQNPDAFKPAGYERAYKLAVEKFDAVHRFTREIAPDKIELALNAADVRRINAQGKKVALMGVENGYPIGEDIARVKEFYDRGARYLSLTHNGHNQLADSQTGERDGWKWNGLSPLGKQVIAEMNRLGIMVDVAHASKESMMQTAALSKAPIIASHSAARALCDVSRNMDDEQLLALKKTGGVIQVVAYSSFVKTTRPDSADRAAALAALRKEYNLPEPTGPGQRARFQAALTQLSADHRAEYDKKHAEIDKQHPGDPPANAQRLRRPYRLCREAHRHRPRRHLLRLRRRRRRHRLERRQRNLQRDSGACPPRLYRTANRKTLGRQPATRHGRSPADRGGAAKKLNGLR